MLKQLTIILISFALGAGVMFLFISPKIAEFRAEQIKIEAFSECVSNKTMGVKPYAELMFTDVLSCYETTIIINEE